MLSYFFRYLSRTPALLLGAVLHLWVSPAPLWAQSDPDPARFAAEIEAFEQWDRKNAVPDRPLVFVGSSSIRMWPIAEAFPYLPVINRGFGGSHLSDVNHYLDRIVLKYRPRGIVLYAGDNDIAAGKTPERVFEDYRAFVEKVHAARPNTPILYVPIKPSLSRWNLWPQMEQANELVRRYAEQHPSLHYADIATPMLGAAGKPGAELFIEDGLHLSPQGYTVWNGVVGPLLKRMLALR